tara:strand:+ start:1297 stop:2220 length:924 start_codon:yes stop_codon:yes gene_type:complete
MVKILITGGAGFIGSSLCDQLIKRSYFVYILDNLSTGKKTNIPNHKNVKFINVDVNNKVKLISKTKNLKIDYIFHFAACVGVLRTLNNPLVVLNDINGFKNIFSLSKSKKIKRIFFSSSSEVYGEGKGYAQNEEKTPLNSRLTYAVVKNIGESFCKAYLKEYKINYTIFRFFNTYGPKQSSDFVISKFLKQAKSNKKITIYGNGRQSRTFCYIDDTTKAIVNCLTKRLYINNTVNIGNNKVVNMYKLANIIKDISNSKSKIVFVKALKEGDMLTRKPDIKKMKKLLNTEYISLSSGIKTILNQYDKK